MRFYAQQCSLIAFLLGFTLVFSGCLKTKITTGKKKSQRKAEIGWAHGFINGLVPPTNAPLKTKSQCGESGVAEVDFRQTFVQGLVSGFTSTSVITSIIGVPAPVSVTIYTPQRIQATCASGESMQSSLDGPPTYLRKDAQGQITASADKKSDSISN